MAVVLCCALAFAQSEPAPLAQNSSGVQTIVVAQGLPVRGLAIGPRSRILVTLSAPGNRVFELVESPDSAKGAGTTSLMPVAGNGDFGSLGDGGRATAAQLNLISGSSYASSGIAVGSDGTVFIADTQNSTIRRIAGPQSSEPGIIRSAAGKWAAPQNVSL